ncbi:MAG: AlpA family phage regulatory protein [Dehalococcoidia bacterium]|nr:AlpA family phage regulatory protein [Dehalococcoidia bacterium]
MGNRLLNRGEVEDFVGLSTSSLYRLMRGDSFPLPIRVGQRAVRWPEKEINEWLESRPRATGDFPPAKGT